MQENVPAVVFGWETYIPFWQWTILPYWSINFVYAASLFFCRTRDELDGHAKRLLTAQIIAVSFFVMAPLHFSFEKPVTSGLPAVLFDALHAFDKSFNQAPSLHIALTLILMDLGLKVLPLKARGALLVWSFLVILSVLTTYQHHFIDIPTGMLLGIFCIWLWPLDRNRNLEWRTVSRKHYKLSAYYLLGTVIFMTIAFALQGWFLWLLWPAASLLCVALSYAGIGHHVFDKSSHGYLNWPSRLLLYPYLTAALINSRLWTFKAPDSVHVCDNVWIGRFPSRKELVRFQTILDMTCEFNAYTFNGEWICVPMLDLVAPDVEDLRHAVILLEQAQQKGPVLVVCALGYGRSVLVVIAWLIKTRRCENVQAALTFIRQRKNVRLSQDQILVLDKSKIFE